MSGKEVVAEAVERATLLGWSDDEPWMGDWNVAQFYVAALEEFEALYKQLIAFEVNSPVAAERRASRRVAYKIGKALKDLKRPDLYVLHSTGETGRGLYVDEHGLSAPADWDDGSPKWEALILAIRLESQMALLAARDAGWRRGGLLIGRTQWLTKNLLKLFPGEEAPAVIAQANDIASPSPVRRPIAPVASAGDPAERDPAPGDVPGESEGEVVRLERDRTGEEKDRTEGELAEAPRVRPEGVASGRVAGGRVSRRMKGRNEGVGIAQPQEEDGWDD